MTANNEMNSLHVIIEGHVQGVGFRYFVKENAERLHLNGWVRNRYDGTVELMAEGSHSALDQLLQAVQTGPSRSIVSGVKQEWTHSLGLYTQFSFLPTE